MLNGGEATNASWKAIVDAQGHSSVNLYHRKTILKLFKGAVSQHSADIKGDLGVKSRVVVVWKET